MKKYLTHDEILEGYSVIKFKKELIKLLNTNRYYLEKYMNLYNLNIKFDNTSVYSLQYWLDRGYTETDSVYQISIRRPYHKNYWINKYGEDKGNVEYYKFITKGTIGKKKSLSTRIKTNTTLEYWLNLGYDMDTASKFLSERQRTFGRDECISKFGNMEGEIIFKKRQDKWQKTLNSKSDSELVKINQSKDSRSINHYKELYNDEWVGKYIDVHFNKNTEFYNVICKCLEYKSLELIIENITKISPKYKYLYRLMRTRLIMDIYNISSNDVDDIVSKMMIRYDGMSEYKKQQYGVRITHEGITYGSYGEFKIAKFFTTNGISFIYNKRYPNSKYRYDFHITLYDVYIEYAGLSGIETYDTRLSKKLKYCIENNFKVLVSDDPNYIIDKIKIKING